MANDKLVQTGKLVSALASMTNPITGLVGSFLFESLAFHSAQKTNELILDLEARLEALEKTGVLEINKLKQDESFLSFLLTACRIAQHTSRNEKINRIKNAVINHGIEHFDDNGSSSVLHLIDQLSEDHFILLSFIRDHIDELNEVDDYNAFYELFTSQCLNMSRDVFGHYVSELKSRRLVRISDELSDDQGLKSKPSLRLEDKVEGVFFNGVKLLDSHNYRL